MNIHDRKVWDFETTKELPACVGTPFTRESWVYKTDDSIHMILHPTVSEVAMLEEAGIFSAWEARDCIRRGIELIIIRNRFHMENPRK